MMANCYDVVGSKNIWLVCIVWTLLIGGSLGWNYASSRKEQKRLAFAAARSSFHQVVMTRQWNAQHGGVYVPVTKNTKPNPYLKVKMRDIRVNPHLLLTKVNPAFMTRQLSRVSKNDKGILFRITSLKPLRPENKPRGKEKTYLLAFEKGVKEKGAFFEKKGKKYFFYMAPLKIKKSCLLCHEKQGYKVGDVRGGISVTLPFTMALPVVPLSLGHAFLWLLGLLGILVYGRRLNQAYQFIQKQSRFDSLTGLPNRRCFTEALLREFRRCRRNKASLSVVMCDVDSFKPYNDVYGHALGDICLQEVARSISKSIRRPADSCARYGGEEFAMILPDTDAKGAKYVSEEVRSNVEGLAIEHKMSPPLNVVTLSLGVATVTSFEDMGYEDLLNLANEALYKAKDAGKNGVIHYDDMEALKEKG